MMHENDFFVHACIFVSVNHTLSQLGNNVTNRKKKLCKLPSSRVLVVASDFSFSACLNARLA